MLTFSTTALIVTSPPTFNVSPDERAVASSDYDSTYDSTYETNHSDSSDFAQNEEEAEGGKKPPEAREGCREFLPEGIVLHPLLPSPEVGNLNLIIRKTSLSTVFGQILTKQSAHSDFNKTMF